MQVAVLGLGYVGCITAAYLAYKGINVIGIDVHQEKVDLINSGKGTFKEDLVHELVSSAVSKGTLRATTNQSRALIESDVIFICVGTPSSQDGSQDLAALKICCAQVGDAIKNSTKFYTVVIRSTIPPGTIETKLIPILESSSGKKAFADFDICMNPEFMREGISVYDFIHPTRLVIGAKTNVSINVLKKIYRDVNAPLKVTDIKTAEFIKYVDNSFHALKVAYANEIASMCKDFGIDFKENTDDLRESPMLEIVKRLKDKGYNLIIYDANLSEKSTLPLNKIFIEQNFPTMFSHFCNNISELAKKSELIIIANRDPVYLDILDYLRDQHIILDCHGVVEAHEHKDRTTTLWR